MIRINELQLNTIIDELVGIGPGLELAFSLDLQKLKRIKTTSYHIDIKVENVVKTYKIVWRISSHSLNYQDHTFHNTNGNTLQ